MKRGDIWIAAARGAYTGKPRPVLIVQADAFAATTSVTICPLTTTQVAAEYLRIDLPADEKTGLQEPSWIMVDKIVTVPRPALVERIGAIGEAERRALNRALVVFLGIA